MIEQHYRLAVTPLSPVHMGTDADYDPTGYIIDDGVLFEFDAPSTIQVLPQSERKEFIRIVSGKPDDAMLRQIQGFFYRNRERLIPYSRRQVRVNPTVEAFYKERVGKVSQYEHGGKRVQNRLEIERTAWNPGSEKPILPGSGIKGAIRTALLDLMNHSFSLPKEFEDPHSRNGSNIARDANTRLQKKLFKGDFQTDPLRLVKLSDLMVRNGCELPTEVLFALNRKKQPVEKDGVLIQSQAEQRGLYQLLECLPPFQCRCFMGTLVVQKTDIGEPGKSIPCISFDIGKIASACNRFYRPILNSELKLLRDRGYVDQNWASAITDLLAELQPVLDDGRAFLLRAGRHSGAESVTLSGVRRIKIMRGRGEKPDWSDSPKTLWLAGYERQAQRGLVPFGWLLIEIDPDEDEPLPIRSTPAHTNLTGWAKEVRDRIEVLRGSAERARTEAEARRREEEEARRRKEAEEAARREAEEQEAARRKAEFEALPESKKRIILFNRALEQLPGISPLNKDQFSHLMGLINSLAEDAASWSRDECASAADAIEAAFEHFGWTPSGLKSDKRKKQEKKRRDLVSRLRR